MEYRIDRRALELLIAERVELVEAVPLPCAVAEVLGARAPHERSQPQELRAVWLAAGLATHIGLAIFEQPERFITAAAGPGPLTA